MTETKPCEFGSSRRLSQQRSARQSKIADAVAGVYLAAEVGWCCNMPDLEGEHEREHLAR